MSIEQQRFEEEMSRDATEHAAAAFDARVENYESFVWADEDAMSEVFGDLNQREHFVQDYCDLKRQGLHASAMAYLDSCLRQEVHNYAEHQCKEND